MLTWHSPQAFFLFVPLVLVLAWLWFTAKTRRPSVVFSSVSDLKATRRSLRSRFMWVPFALKVGAVALAIVALARPQRADTKIKKNVEGIDIMIALDISDSMLIEDMTPENRLESSKETIKRFVESRVSDRLGMVVFSGESYTRVPLTLDYPLFLQSLAEVETSRNIKMGTAIGVALANAVGRLKDSTAKSRVVIFLTDGENNSGTIDPETALEIAKGYGVKIYSIGMGRDGQAQLPIYIQNAQGQKIKRYRPIHSAVNDQLLGDMAAQTSGKYWRATTSQALQGVFDEINRLERTKIEVNTYTQYEELFPRWLEASLLMFLVSLFLARTVLRRGP
jgi:Ca-activated chloride channel family protein